MWNPPKPFLMVTKNSYEIRESVTRFESENAINAGISWGAIGPGIVPIFEEHATRMERGYTLQAWYELEPLERAMTVAMRRIDIASKNLQMDAEIRHSKQNARKK